MKQGKATSEKILFFAFVGILLTLILMKCHQLLN